MCYETNNITLSKEATAQIHRDNLPEEERLQINDFEATPIANLEITITLNGVVIDCKEKFLTKAEICQNLCGKIESALTCFAHEVVKYPSRKLWEVLASLTSRRN